MRAIRKNKRNRGSTVIEMSLLIPVFLGCIYFYIMLFLFFTQAAKKTEEISEYAYMSESTKTEQQKVLPDNVRVQREGKIRVIKLEEQGKLFTLKTEFRRDENDPVQNLRRWQLVSDTFQ